MSKFKTSIPVDIKGVMGLLPKGTHIHGTKLNEAKTAVEVEWDHDGFKTPVTFATEFPAENIRSGKVPDGVQIVQRVEAAKVAPSGGAPGEAPAKVPKVPKVPTPKGAPKGAPVSGATGEPVGGKTV